MSVAGFESFARFQRREVLASDVLETTQPVIGWRCWRVLPYTRLDGTETMRLCAVGTLGMPKVWEPRKPTVALCSSYASAHEAPSLDSDQNHQCGLWALKRSEEARRRMIGFMISQGGRKAGWAFGRVSLWGRVIEHDRGYRGQYAYPYALTIEAPDGRVARAVRDEYAVDVEWAGGELFEKTGAKREQRDQAKREAKEQWNADWEANMEALKLAQPKPRRRYFWASDVTADQLVEAVREAQANSIDGAATSREVCVAYALATGFTEEDIRNEHHRMAQELKRAMWGGHVLQLKQRNKAISFWCLPGTVLSDRFSVREDLHAREDAEALAALQETLKAMGKDVSRTRDVFAYLGQPNPSRREQTMLGQALGRQIHRGNVREAERTGSAPNKYMLMTRGHVPKSD